MLGQSIMRRVRPLSVRARIFSGVVLSAIATVPRAGAQQPPGPPQQQEQQTSPAPAVPQEPAAKSPAANSPAGQTQLPEIVVSGNQPKPKKPKPNVQASQRSAPTPTQAAVARGAPTPTQAAVARDAPTPAQAALDSKMKTMDQALNNLLPKTGATVDTLTRQDIVNLPQGDNTPIDKVILQFPGVSYDSAVSNPSFHVRGEYGNVQIRINGIVLPEGVSGLGPIPRHQFHRQHVTAHRYAAGPVRTAHRRRARHHQPELRGPRWRGQSLWRQPSDAHAEHRLRRQFRQQRVFRHRARHLEHARLGKSNGQPQRHPRLHSAGQVFRL